MKKLREESGNFLFIDIETVREQKELERGTPTFEAWVYMVKRKLEQGVSIEEDYVNRAGLYAEFSRIVCISVAYIKGGELIMCSYSHREEAVLLARFMGALDSFLKCRKDAKLTGHSVKGFDIPFIFRRCLKHGIICNRLIDVADKKPWEVSALDTKELWKSTGYYSASLVAVCLCLGIPSPKADISGAEVSDVYYNEGEEGMERIVRYCEQDVMAVANVVRKCRLEPIFTEYKKVKPKPLRIGLMDKIAKIGRVDGKNKEELMDKVKGATYEEKQKIIKLLNAALLITGGSVSHELEIEILKAQ